MAEVKTWMFFAEGKRSDVYRKKIRGKIYVKKVAKKGRGIEGHIANEIRFLRILNKKRIDFLCNYVLKTPIERSILLITHNFTFFFIFK